MRRYLYRQARLALAKRVLDVGCGTGVLLAEISRLSAAQAIGIDLDASRLYASALHAPEAALLHADGLRLPLSDASFDICLCHFLLLWVKEPRTILEEMRRVTHPGGAVIAMAEPDYGGRIDYPDALAELGKMQQESLIRQGADPMIGRKLKSLFHQAGLKQVEAGVIGAQWSGTPDQAELELEWKVLQADLEGQHTTDAIEKMRSQEDVAWERGERVLFVPTFYAWGLV